jgi:hypothetical protein
MLYMQEFIYKFEVFTVVTMKIAIFWDVTPCGSISLQHFSVARYC